MVEVTLSDAIIIKSMIGDWYSYLSGLSEAMPKCCEPILMDVFFVLTDESVKKSPTLEGWLSVVVSEGPKKLFEWVGPAINFGLGTNIF